MLFEMTGKPPSFFPVPVALMDGLIGLMDAFGTFFPQARRHALQCTIDGRTHARKSSG